TGVPITAANAATIGFKPYLATLSFPHPWSLRLAMVSATRVEVLFANRKTDSRFMYSILTEYRIRAEARSGPPRRASPDGNQSSNASRGVLRPRRALRARAAA